MVAPRRPRISGNDAIPNQSSRIPPRSNVSRHAAAPTNDGITRGSTAVTRHTLRPGRSVRTVSQASATPRAVAPADTSTVSWTLRHSGSTVRRDVSARQTAAQSSPARISR